MVLGLSAKNRKSASVQVDYLIHIQEIKPWPPSQSLRSLRSVLIQWENADRLSGSTNTVVPSLGSIVGEGKIEFSESFKLPVTLFRETSAKGRDATTFQKNCIEFNLYEPRRDKTQLLATAIVDLADYGVVKETLHVSAPMNCKRSFSNTAQPILSIKIQPINTGQTNSSSKDSLSKQASVDKNGVESVSALMNEEYAEEAETASFTDDDMSSHSSLTVSSSSLLESSGHLPQHTEENGPAGVTNRAGGDHKEHTLPSKLSIEKSNTMPQILPCENQKESSSSSSSIDLSSDNGSPLNGHATTSDSPLLSSTLIQKHINHSVHSSTSLIDANTETEAKTSVKSSDHEDFSHEPYEKVSKEGVASSDKSSEFVEQLSSVNHSDSLINGKDDKKSLVKTAALDDHNNSMEYIGIKTREVNGQRVENIEQKMQFVGDEPLNSFSQDAERNQVLLGSDALSSSEGNFLMKVSSAKSDRLKHVKSVRSPSDSGKIHGLTSNNQPIEANEVNSLGDPRNSVVDSQKSNERKDAKVYPKDTRSAILDSKIQQLENKVKMLEGELREAAAMESALYSVVAEHGSSMSKVHCSARRISRLYLHACRESSQSRKASAARSAISGLVMVAKACGNDVPRLTFWLSNSVVLRAIIIQIIRDQELRGANVEKGNGQRASKKISSSLRWKESFPRKNKSKRAKHGNYINWEDPNSFTSALEKVEAWIFSRIIESIWWQTLTPHMQSAATKAIDKDFGSGLRKNCERMSTSGDQDQGNLSLDLWKKAFKDACERICPVRAGGHECGCLPVLARLIMEQCVARLDVAMFNAILRESAEEIPTDPVSDPISESKVLPIPAGKSSFGAGAQLKNAIGNWSRWLTDLFGIDDDDALEDENHHNEVDYRQNTSFKSFHLLNALSDLMMLPKDMLLSSSIRKEVCPTFGAPLIKRVLDNFVPDEFCPDPIPDVVLEALNTEDTFEDGEETITSFPCIAAPPVYSPPSAASLAAMIGEVGSQSQSSQLTRTGSSLLRKSYTSDDELDQLNSPFDLITFDSSRSKPSSKENGNRTAFRYELLRDIWMNCE